ncbi:hypothetical protein V2J09_018369 [Rumex salicifolius]
MSISCIQNRLLEITVVECTKLKDTEWFSRQDPFVCLEYGSTKFRTRTCTDGGKTPVFQEKFVFTLIQGLTEINVVVWNSNTVYNHDFIGSGKIQLQDVLARGYDDRCWPIQTRSGRFAGEVKLIMHYTQPNAPAPSYGPAYIAAPQPMAYTVPPPPPPVPMYTNAAYQPPYVQPTPAYQTPMPPCTSPYPSYPPPPQQQLYPPPPHGYPTTTYPPPPSLAPPYGQYGAYPTPPYY